MQRLCGEGVGQAGEPGGRRLLPEQREDGRGEQDVTESQWSLHLKNSGKSLNWG